MKKKLTFRADCGDIRAAIAAGMAVVVTEAVGRVPGAVARLTAVVIVTARTCRCPPFISNSL